MPRIGRPANLRRNMTCRGKDCHRNIPLLLQKDRFHYMITCDRCGTRHEIEFEPSGTDEHLPGRMDRKNMKVWDASGNRILTD